MGGGEPERVLQMRRDGRGPIKAKTYVLDNLIVCVVLAHQRDDPVVISDSSLSAASGRSPESSRASSLRSVSLTASLSAFACLLCCSLVLPMCVSRARGPTSADVLACVWKLAPHTGFPGVCNRSRFGEGSFVLRSGRAVLGGAARHRGSS